MDNAVTGSPRRYGAVNVIGLRTLIGREIWRFLKVSAQTIIAPLVSTVLFMVVFTLALGRGASPFPGVSYAEFLAPGLVMMAILSNAFANSSSSLVIAKVQGNAVDFLMPPFAAWELTLAFVVGAAVRGLLVGLAALVAVLPFAALAPAHVWAVAFYALAGSVIFAAAGLIGGIWAEKFDNIAAVTNFIITPLTFLSGSFYAIDQLPAPFAAIGHYNPVFFLIDGFRYGFVGAHDGPLLFGALASLALAAGLSLWAWALVRSGYRLKA